MRSAYLIDGYNLLHAAGALSGRLGPGALERARGLLLRRLRAALGEGFDEVTVVFDAANAPRGATGEADFGGVRVRFAVQQDEADDLIELLIRRDAAPRQLTVVSDDRRLRRAARRRGCVVRGCGDFLDWLERRRGGAGPLRQAPPEKAEQLSAEERRYWLEEFGGLEDDPDFRRLFRPYDFGGE